MTKLTTKITNTASTLKSWVKGIVPARSKEAKSVLSPAFKAAEDELKWIIGEKCNFDDGRQMFQIIHLNPSKNPSYLQSFLAGMGEAYGLTKYESAGIKVLAGHMVSEAWKVQRERKAARQSGQKLKAASKAAQNEAQQELDLDS